MKKVKSLQLEDVIFPISKEKFIKNFWGNTFLFQSSNGNKKRFSHLLPWGELNRLLAEHRLDDPRLRLSKDGRTISSHEYTNYFPTRRGNSIPRLIPDKLNKELINGATLIIDAVDELFEPIKRLSQNLEFIFNETIQVNAYLGWGNTTGFDTHWDDHDVFILQVFGKKKWYIYGETRKYPLYRDVEIDKIKPQKPIWKKTINAGDIIYLPRGWWHNAIPCNEPSLHLTFGVTNRTGIDFYNWISEILLKDEFFRKDIPLLKSKAEQVTYLNQFSEKLNTIVKQISLDEFLNNHNSNSVVRQRFTLPFSVHKASKLSKNSTIVLTISRQIHIKTSGNSLSFVANGNEWIFSLLTKPFFDLLFKKRECLIEEAIKTCPEIDNITFDLFIKELFGTGLIYIDQFQN